MVLVPRTVKVLDSVFCFYPVFSFFFFRFRFRLRLRLLIIFPSFSSLFCLFFFCFAILRVAQHYALLFFNLRFHLIPLRPISSQPIYAKSTTYIHPYINRFISPSNFKPKNRTQFCHDSYDAHELLFMRLSCLIP